jgi:streptogramin lyase
VAYGDGAVWVNRIRPVAGFPSGGILVRVHPTTLTVQSEIDVPEAGRVAVGEGSVWILGSQLNRVNPKSEKAADPIEVPSIGQNIGLSAVDLAVANGAVWILDSNGPVFKVDPTSNKVTSKFTTGTKAIAMAVGEGGIWVLSRVEESVVRVDLATGALARPIHIGANPLGIAVGDGSVWVARGGG